MAFGNALDALAKRRTPLLVFRAGADAIPGLLPVLDAAVTQALARDLEFELVDVPGAPHSFDMTSTPAVMESLVTRTIEFLR